MAEKSDLVLAQQLDLEVRLAKHQAEMASKVQEITADNVRRSEALLRELSDARVELNSARESLAVDLERAKVEISGVAIDKTLRVFSEAKSVVQAAVLIVVPILFGAGFMAYSSLKSTTAMFVDTKVKEWLALSTPDSPVKTTLDQLRTRAILDAFTVRLSRQQTSESMPTERIGLSSDELARLRQIMLDPSSTSSDFSDAARLIKASRGIGASVIYDQEVAKVINTILSSREFDEERKEYLLVVWWQERALVPASVAILDAGTEKYGERWSLFAFKNVARNSPDLASKYASGLLQSKQEGSQMEAARYLTQNDPMSPDLVRWLEKLRLENSDRYVVALASVASNSVEYMKTHTSPELLEVTATRLYKAISSGASLRLSQYRRDRNLVWQHQVRNVTYSDQIDQVTAYFERDDLLTKVMQFAGDDISQLTMLISALEVTAEDRPLAAIQVTLKAGATIVIESPGGNLTKDRTLGPIRLSVQGDSGAERLRATWQRPDGGYSSAWVLSVSKLEDAAFRYSIDQDRVGPLDMRRLAEYFQ